MLPVGMNFSPNFLRISLDSYWIAGPPASQIANASPSSCMSYELALLTITSTFSLVMSPDLTVKLILPSATAIYLKISLLNVLIYFPNINIILKA
jgi:hypothetical protein